MKLATLSTITLLTAFSLLSSKPAQAEIRRHGVVLETSCATNRQLPSDITRICFAQVVGLPGEFLTTRNLNGLTQVWKLTQRIDSSENEQEIKHITEILELASVGVVQNRFLVRAADAEILTASLRQTTSLFDGAMEVEGSFGLQPLTASNFETYLFTMDQPEQDL